MIILFYKILNYKNNKERFQEKAQDKYKELFYEENDINREYWRNWYSNMSEEDQ